MLKLSNINFTAKAESLTAIERSKKILSNISFKVMKGDILGIVGESGAGKTTLAKILAGINLPDSGEILFKDKVYKNLFNELSIQFLFQNSAELINPHRTVKDILQDTAKTNQLKIDEKLKLVNLPKSIQKRLGKELSGGERQRVGLLRVLSVNPKLLLIDEPFSAQDIESQLNLMRLLKKIKQENDLTIVCISHDLQIISKFTNKLVVMKDGKIVEQGETSDILRLPKHYYTKFLIKSKNYNVSPSDFNHLNGIEM